MLAACSPNACRASGRGLQPKGVRIRETADFKVDTKAAGSGELSVTVKGPSKCAFLSPSLEVILVNFVVVAYESSDGLISSTLDVGYHTEWEDFW